MPAGLLPIFPLQVVVFPRTRIPLHIFEERYKEMVGEAIRDHTEFGIVLAKEDGIVNVGCTVSVEKVLKRHPDGRMDILTIGRRRFEVLYLDEEKSYLRAEVQYFDDDDESVVPVAVHQAALEQFRELLNIGELPAYIDPDLQDPQLSFQIAQSIDDVDFLHLLLRTRSESSRLKEVAEFLTRYIPQRRETMRMRMLAPLNGSGRRPDL
jgi:Lon protease-like protein